MALAYGRSRKVNGHGAQIAGHPEKLIFFLA